MSLYVRSALFLIWFAVVSLAFNVAGLPLLVFPRRATVWAANKWARLLLFGLEHIVGLKMEVRGSAPQRCRPHRRQALQHVGDDRAPRAPGRTGHRDQA